MSNYVNKNGNVSGNWLTTYDDGSTMYGTFTGTSQTPKDTNQDSISVGSSLLLVVLVYIPKLKATV